MRETEHREGQRDTGRDTEGDREILEQPQRETERY